MWPPQPGQSCCAGYSTRSRSGRARANNLAISCLQKQSKHYSLNARASQLCQPSFFVTKAGHVATNAHVVEGCNTLRLRTASDTDFSGRVIARDPTNDLALLKTGATPTHVAALRMGVRLGEPVAAFGFPLAPLLSSAGNFTRGDVTALSGIGDDSRFFQVSVPVQPGNSGGPLLDSRGNLVGVVTSKLSALKIMVATGGDLPQNVNFAIKSTVLANFLETNQVASEVGRSTSELPSPDLAEEGRRMSVFIRCN